MLPHGAAPAGLGVGPGGDPKVDVQAEEAGTGTILEELIRKFNEALNENRGEHFTSSTSWSTWCLATTGGGCVRRGS